MSLLIVSLVADGSKWVVVRCGTLEEKEKLLAAKIMWLREAKLFIIFRKICFKPYLTKFIQLAGLSTPELWEKALATLRTDGVKITPTAPKVFEPNYTERVVWKIEHKDEHWVPETIALSVYEVVRVAWAPICMFCSSEDHFHTLCTYPKLVGAVPTIKRAKMNSNLLTSRHGPNNHSRSGGATGSSIGQTKV